jgi:uncharacterized protein (TIGR02996 family)
VIGTGIRGAADTSSGEGTVATDDTRHDAAFLDAVRENPDDDTPRLVYADWLDEHGQPERAEFIRVQCALARLDPDDPRHPEMFLREKALASQPGARGEGLPTLAGVSWGSYRRGFVASASVSTVKQFRKHAAALFAATPLEDLSISRLTPSDARTLAAMPELARLRGLTFGPGTGPDGLRELLLSPRLASLARLDLGYRVVAPEVVSALGEANLPALTTLRLSGAGLGSTGAQVLADALHFPLLSTLVLTGCNIADGPAALAGSRGLSGLIHLDLSGKGITDAGAVALAASPYLSRLATLHLGGNQIGAPGVAALIGSQHLAELRRLNLSANRFGPTQGAVAEAGLAAYALPPPKARPVVLHLLNNQIDDDGAVRLAEWPGLGRLVALDLGLNKITHVGVDALAASPYLAGLSRLTLNDNPVELAGLWSLAASPHLARLTLLGMSKSGHSSTTRTPPPAPAGMPAWTGLSLSLKGNGLGSDAAGELAAWPGLARVQKLDPGSNHLGAAGAAALAASPHACGLTELDLEFNKIGDEGATSLAASPHLAGLKSLNLGRNEIGNAGAQAVASSPHLAGLTSLNLGANAPLGHAGAKALVQSPHLGGLTFLGLHAPHAFGTVMAEALRQRFGEALRL